MSSKIQSFSRSPTLAFKPGRGRVGPGVIIYSIGTGGDFKLVHQWTLINFNGFILAMAWILVTNFLFKCIYKRTKDGFKMFSY